MNGGMSQGSKASARPLDLRSPVCHFLQHVLDSVPLPLSMASMRKKKANVMATTLMFQLMVLLSASMLAALRQIRPAPELVGIDAVGSSSFHR